MWTLIKSEYLKAEYLDDGIICNIIKYVTKYAILLHILICNYFIDLGNAVCIM